MPNTIAHRKVFGVLVPYFNSVVEPELADLRPPAVTNQTARFALDADVLQNIVGATNNLMSCGIEAVILGLSPESFPGGLDLLQQGVEQLVEATRLPVFTPTHANHAALRHLGAQRVAIATPFDNEGNRHVRAAYEAAGFTVVRIEGLACTGFDQIARTPPDEIRRLFLEIDSSDSEALVQVGTGLPVLHLIDELEQNLSKPVVASNACVYWQALRESGIADEIQGFGRLLGDHSPRRPFRA
jgi:maleate isomerase